MNKKLVIGMIGKAGSGKDTVGDYLVKNYGFTKLALADPLKAGVKSIFMLDEYTVYDREARERPLEDFPEWSVRKLLQFVGTELFRNHFDGDIWVKLLLKNIRTHANDRIVVTDVRFPNELNMLKASKAINFHAVKVVREGCLGHNVGIQNHASEKHDLESDIVIENNKTVGDLYDNVVKEIVGKYIR